MKQLTSIFVVVLCLGLNQQSLGQEQFSLAQYYQLSPILNPGFTGIEDYLDIKLGYRKKWAGFNNSPSTSFISAFGSIGDETSYSQSPIRTSNPNQVDYIESEKSYLKFHGIGGYITSQSQGAFNQIDVMLNYAYHIPIKENIRISLGSTIGIKSMKVDLNEINVWDQINDPVYIAYANGDGNYTNFVVSLGGVLYGDKSYIGVSYMPVIDATMTGNKEDLISDRELIIMSGTKLHMGRFIQFIPSVVYEAHTRSKSRIIGNISFDIKSIIKAGFGYSNANDLSFNLFLNYKNDFGLGYAFETSVGNESTIGNGTHELILSFSLFNHLNSSPRLW